MNDWLFSFWLRLRLRFPLLLLGQAVDWRRESRITVSGFAVLWLLAEISRELLGQRRGDLQALTLDHLAQAFSSTQWWYCVVLLSGMSAAAIWVSRAAGGSFGEAVQRGQAMLDALVLTASEAGGRGRAEAELQLRGMVLGSVTSPHTRRNYSKALDLLFALAAGRPFTRALLLEYRTSMEGLAPSTVNVRLAAVRKLVEEARRNGLLSSEEAANLTDVPNVRQRGTRLGNWLTKEQARELLQVPDRSTLKGKRDHAMLSLLTNCGLRRMELSKLQVENIQMRENRWVLADIRGKGNRVRTVAVPISSKQALNAWQTAAGIEEGPLFRSIRKNGKVGQNLSDWAVWDIVTASAREIGIENFGAHDLRRTCAKLCRKAGGDLEQIKFLLGHSSIQTTERYLGSEQEIAVAVNDSLGL